MTDFNQIESSQRQHHDEILFHINLSAAEDQQIYTRFALLRPTLTIDGNQWCCLYGEDLQSGIAGFGDTPHKAILAWLAEFDRPITKGEGIR